MWAEDAVTAVDDAAASATLTVDDGTVKDSDFEWAALVGDEAALVGDDAAAVGDGAAAAALVGDEAAAAAPEAAVAAESHAAGQACPRHRGCSNEGNQIGATAAPTE